MSTAVSVVQIRQALQFKLQLITNMNIMKQTLYKILIASLIAFGALTPVLVNAQTTASSTRPTTCVGQNGGKCSNDEKKVFDLQNRGIKELDRRVANLTKLLNRVNDIRNLTVTQKASISATIQSEITTLTTLKNDISSDSGTSTLRTKVESITKSYRIYALIMPQINIIAAADRATTVISMLNTVGSKLQARIAADANASSTIANLNDFGAKLADAQAQIQAAVNEATVLSPDNGDKDKFQSNLTALKDARSKIQAAQKDLVAARKDAQAIAKVLMTNIKNDLKMGSTTKEH
jgi:hypothetical protein